MNKNWIVILGFLLASTSAFADGAAGMAPASLGSSSQPALSCDANQFTENSKTAESLVSTLFGESSTLQKVLMAKDKKKGPDLLGRIEIKDVKGKLHLTIAGLTVPAKLCQAGSNIMVFADTSQIHSSPMVAALIGSMSNSLKNPVVLMSKVSQGAVQLSQVGGNLISPRVYEWTSAAAAR